MNKQHLVLACDFDGTIVTHDYPNIGKPIKNAFKVLKQLQRNGHKLILWTCRQGKELQEAIDYCKQNGLEFNAVNENVYKSATFNPYPKVYADMYIDDRGYGAVIDWDEIELDIASKYA